MMTKQQLIEMQKEEIRRLDRELVETKDNLRKETGRREAAEKSRDSFKDSLNEEIKRKDSYLESKLKLIDELRADVRAFTEMAALVREDVVKVRFALPPEFNDATIRDLLSGIKDRIDKEFSIERIKRAHESYAYTYSWTMLLGAIPLVYVAYAMLKKMPQVASVDTAPESPKP